MENYFRLNSYSYLVEGNGNGCIYDLASGNMIILEKEKYEMLELCEQNLALKDIPGIDHEFIKKLQSINVGLYYDAPVYIDKSAIGIPQQLEAAIPNNYAVNTVFIELDNKCNFDCVFCKKNDNKLFRKTGCKRWSVGDKISGPDMWKNIIKQVSDLSCKHIAFIGGEPFLHDEVLKELCTYAFKHGIIKISIYTNGSILNEESISFLKKYNIELCIQIFGYSDSTYERITGKPGMGTAVFENVKRIAAENIKYKLSYLVSRLNEDELETAVKEYAQFVKPDRIEADFIYPVPENEYYSDKYLELMYDKKRQLGKARINVSNFCNAKKQHNCYGYQIGITADGQVIPCIMSRSFNLGSVKEKGIRSILDNSQYEYYRKLNKDTIPKCKTCSLRYGCFDCRALEMSATGDILGLEYCNI